MSTSKHLIRPNGRKIVKRINGSYNQGLSFRKYRLQQISTHICDYGGGFVDAISFPAETTAAPVQSSALRVFVFIRRLCFRFFYLTHFVWLPATFRNAVTRNSSEGVLLFSNLLGQASFRLPRPPFPPPPLSSNRHGGSDKRSGASYRLLALIRRLHCRLMFVICYICHINLTQVKKGILRPYLLLPTSESIFLT